MTSPLNQGNRTRLARAAGVTLALLSTPALAFDTICYQFHDPHAPVAQLGPITSPTTRGCEGIEGARGRYRDPVHRVDEHRQIFAKAVAWAGLDGALLETQTLSVLTHGLAVQGAWGPTPSVSPWWTPAGPGVAAFSGAKRSFSIDEFAGLPDVSYGLWDWASGNETCPLPLPAQLADPQICHRFATHMGALNSSHFPPQSDRWYDHYHQLALDSARQCLGNRMLVWDHVPTLVNGETQEAVDSRMRETWKACEVESLAYEAIAQHFLHDWWSAGHMWQRWGSSNLADFKSFTAWGPGASNWNSLPLTTQQLLIGQSVALVAGSIHGSDPVLFESKGFSLHDPLSHPNVDVKAKSAPNSLPDSGSHVVGDLHLHDILPGPDMPSHLSLSWSIFPLSMNLDYQRLRLMECTAGSLGEVYEALDDIPERFQPVLGDAPATPVAFDREACRAHMVTNNAFFTGLKFNEGWASFPDQLDYYIGAILVTVFGPSQIPRDAVGWDYQNRLMWDYRKLYARASLRSWMAPNATDLAQNPLPIMQTRPNSAYNPPAPTAALADAPAQGGVLPHGSNETTKAGKIALTFHRSRAPEFCYRADTFDVVDSLGETIRRTRRMPAGNPTEQKMRDAAVQACAEWVAPFVWNKDSWNNSDPDSNRWHYDAAPLCSYLPHYPNRMWIDPGRSGNHYALGDGTPLTGDWAAYPRRGMSNAAVAYDRATSYVGGNATDDNEKLAKLMCGAPLVATAGGGFRISGRVTGLHEDAALGFFLRSSTSPPLSRDKRIMVGGRPRPMFRWMGKKGAENPWIDDEQRVLVRLVGADDYDYVAVSTDIDADYTEREGLIAYRDVPEDSQSPEHYALYAVHGARNGLGDTHGGGDGRDYYFNNPQRDRLPHNGLYVLQPLTPVNGLQQCTFAPATQSLNLDAANPEAWDVHFTATCVPTNPLTVTIDGSGDVIAETSGLTCDNSGVGALATQTCTMRFVGEVRLKAVGSGFSGWSGACGGSGDTCTVTMDGAKSVTATFN